MSLHKLFNAAQRWQMYLHSNDNYTLILGAEVGKSRHSLVWLLCGIVSLHRLSSRHRAAISWLCKNALFFYTMPNLHFTHYIYSYWVLQSLHKDVVFATVNLPCYLIAWPPVNIFTPQYILQCSHPLIFYSKRFSAAANLVNVIYTDWF